MGTFNTVKFRCPMCRRYIRVQTKAGNCDMKTITMLRAADYPEDIADVAARGPYACECGEKLRLRVRMIVDVLLEDDE